MSTSAAICLERARQTVHAHAMLKPGQRVLAAVSGGPDSVALLHLLRELGYPLVVAHFDHQTRQGESGDDARFVQEMANALTLPLAMDSADVEAGAQRSTLSFEQYARQQRYAFLMDAARVHDCEAVATGHHADDQVETILMRMVRGTSPKGLAGIPPVRESGGVRIVRPLIDCTRAQLLAYLAARGLAYRSDRTNADTTYLRNRIRHELLPYLRDKCNPQVDEALLRLGAVLRDESALLHGLGESFLERCLCGEDCISREHFAKGHPALQRRALVLFTERCGFASTFDRVEEARRLLLDGETGKACDLGGGLLLRLSRGHAEIVRPGSAAPEPAVLLAVPGETAALGRRFRVRFLDALPPLPLKTYCTPQRQLFDAETLGGTLVARRRQPGDRFMPFGMKGTKKLKDYFIGLGLSWREREEAVVLESGGRIIWIAGYALDARAAVTEKTRRILEVEVHDAS
jgi:tRNA(Ile)-lysidine synthase